MNTTSTYTNGTGASSKQSQQAGVAGVAGKWTSNGFVATKQPKPAPKSLLARLFGK